MTAFIVHISDTHYAKPGEELCSVGKSSMPTWHGPFASLLAPARQWILSRNGADCHRPLLWDALGDALRDVATVLDPQQTLVLHSGDVSQAGQVNSVKEALTQLRNAAAPIPFQAFPGNHDLWPGAFPIYAASGTFAQANFVRCEPPMPRCFASQIPVHPSMQLFMLNSVVPDSLLNTLALGSLGAEFAAGAPTPFEEQWDRLGAAPDGVRIRAAALHHPVYDFAKDPWRTAAEKVFGPTHMTLVDGKEVRQRLGVHQIALVFCGHEHELPTAKKHLMFENGKVLQLAVGTPTSYKAPGSDSDPHFCVYEIDFQGPKVLLTRAVCWLHPSWWEFPDAFEYDQGVWRQVQPNPSQALQNLRGPKQRPPFP